MGLIQSQTAFLNLTSTASIHYDRGGVNVDLWSTNKQREEVPCAVVALMMLNCCIWLVTQCIDGRTKHVIADAINRLLYSDPKKHFHHFVNMQHSGKNKTKHGKCLKQKQIWQHICYLRKQATENIQNTLPNTEMLHVIQNYETTFLTLCNDSLSYNTSRYLA